MSSEVKKKKGIYFHVQCCIDIKILTIRQILVIIKPTEYASSLTVKGLRQGIITRCM